MTGIVRPILLGAAPLGCLNVHHGLLPEIRGADEVGSASEAEVALAGADVSCNLAAGLEKAWYAADVEAQARLVAHAEVTPDTYEAMLGAADERAREILGR